MAFNGKIGAAAFKIQSAAGTYATIATPADLAIVYDLRPSGESYKVANPEATGTEFSAPDETVGRSRSVTFNMIVRGPGGVTPPAADTFMLGKFLRMRRHVETVQTTAALATGALSGGTTTTAILPVGASSVDDAYTGLCAILSGVSGTGLKQVSMIRKYVGATRTATFMETFPSALTGNITIPPYLGYQTSDTAPILYGSFDYWMDKKRYKMVDCIVSGWSEEFQVSNNSNTQFTYVSVTLTGDVHPTIPELDENTPTVSQGGTMPFFLDADYYMANLDFCGSGMSYSESIETARAPCPASTSGGEAQLTTKVSRQGTFNINEVLMSKADVNALAAAKLDYGIWLQYGQGGAGKCVSRGWPNARIEFSEAEAGDFVTRAVPINIAGVNKSSSWMFPYGF